MNKKNVILRDKFGAFRIEKLSLTDRPSEFVQIAPPSFGPGDEEFIKQGKDGKLIFDYEGKFRQAKKANEPKRQAARKEKWNQASIVDRLKMVFRA